MQQYPQFYHLSGRRYSCRKYSSTPISADLLMAVIDAARLAPSACNRQPWQFVVVKNPQLREALQRSYGREWFNDAPTYIVALGLHNEAWHRPYDGKDHTDVDVAIAVEHLCLAATSLGLSTCWVCNFDPEIVSQALQLTDGVEPIAIIPIGYSATEGAGEAPDKKRKPLDEIVRWAD